MKKTKWFKNREKPIHKGMYQTKYDGVIYYTYWNGHWAYSHVYLDTAIAFRNTRTFNQNKVWRGLAEKPE